MSGHSSLKIEAADLSGWMEVHRARVETALDRRLPSADSPPAALHRAMRYSALAGGKYLRPMLVYATGDVFGADAGRLDGAACAVELIHAYSLIHDDLPAMDDDALRRGKPSCHVAFGEAMAILAGDALQALAFQILAEDPGIDVDPAQRLKMIEVLARAAGSLGMAGGQAIDLQSVGGTLAPSQLEDMHLRKTGALIRASVMLGALGSGNRDGDVLRTLDEYARGIGLAFQVRDDVLDVEGETAVLGKTQGSDRHRDKPTYCSVFGVEEARKMAAELYRSAVDRLAAMGTRADTLRALSAYIVRRDR
jgi:geranylgeranyl pyrophosphate synthase